MPGIVACEALYALVERFAPHAPVRYLPAELHEFPVNVPLEDEIGRRVQAAIDELDEPGRETIVVSYAMAADTREGLTAEHASLRCAADADCTSTVLPDRVDAYGENKAPRTWYLTRGWIDCGVDAYKLYRAYLGDLEGLVARFETAVAEHPDLRVGWPDGERFARAVDRPSPVAADRLDAFFRDVVGYYDRVVLVDTGDLHPLHHEYAEDVRRFVARLQAEGADVELAKIDADTDRFEALLAG
ncbi:MAG: DUF1638 domain-containing protein [Halobacteriales archaeon]|nr:DUF1638 domain-containing protein [Halobacteriales archaeon]